MASATSSTSAARGLVPHLRHQGGIDSRLAPPPPPPHQSAPLSRVREVRCAVRPVPVFPGQRCPGVSRIAFFHQHLLALTSPSFLSGEIWLYVYCGEWVRFAVLMEHTDVVKELEWSKDGWLLSGGCDRCAYVWRLNNQVRNAVDKATGLLGKRNFRTSSGDVGEMENEDDDADEAPSTLPQQIERILRASGLLGGEAYDEGGDGRERSDSEQHGTEGSIEEPCSQPSDHDMTSGSEDSDAPLQQQVTAAGRLEDRYASAEKLATMIFQPELVQLDVKFGCTCLKWAPDGRRFCAATAAGEVVICSFVEGSRTQHPREEERGDFWQTVWVVDPRRSQAAQLTRGEPLLEGAVLCLAWCGNMFLAVGCADRKTHVLSAFRKTSNRDSKRYSKEAPGYRNREIDAELAMLRAMARATSTSAGDVHVDDIDAMDLEAEEEKDLPHGEDEQLHLPDPASGANLFGEMTAEEKKRYHQQLKLRRGGRAATNGASKGKGNKRSQSIPAFGSRVMTLSKADSWPCAVAFEERKMQLAVASMDSTVVICGMASREEHTVRWTGYCFSALCFVTGGEVLVGGGHDAHPVLFFLDNERWHCGGVCVPDAEPLLNTARLSGGWRHENQIMDCRAVDSEGRRFATCGLDGKVLLWDMAITREKIDAAMICEV